MLKCVNIKCINKLSATVIIIEIMYYIYGGLGKDLSLTVTIFLLDLRIILFMFME